ncbi:MAG: extracellular solute-binding protein [Alphaproteobacteria bacterium]|nr:extracellular solute-binding protein [Alphaproteobacteria bacterium]
MLARAALAFAALLATVASAGAQPAGEITVMAYAGIFEDKYKAAVIVPFTQQFPQVKVNYFTAGNSAQMLGTLRAQRSSPQIDVAILDVSVSNVGNKEGVFSRLDPAKVPSLKELHALAAVPGGFGPAVTFDHWVLVYDVEKVKPAPAGLADLWDPRFKGQLGLSAMPNIQGIVATVLASKIVGEDYKVSIDGAMKRLKDLGPSVQTFDPQPDGYTLILGNTLTVASGWNARAQLYHDDSKGRLGVVFPKEGSVFQINTINLVAGSKNPEAATAFIEHALGRDAQKRFTESMFYAPTNAKAEVAPAAIARTAASPDNMARMIPLDWDWVTTIRDAWNNRWRREVIAGR